MLLSTSESFKIKKIIRTQWFIIFFFLLKIEQVGEVGVLSIITKM